MKRSGVMIAVVFLVAILFAGNGLLIAHAAGPNGQGAGASGHSNSGNGHNTGSGTNDHSSGSNNGGNSQGSGTVDQNLGTNDPSTPNLGLTIIGFVANAGFQHYIVHQMGEVNNASFMENVINTTLPSTLDFTLNANVHGTSANGYANFELNGSLDGGGAMRVSGTSTIIRMIPAVCLPSGLQGVCSPMDRSAVPAFFVGLATTLVVTITISQGETLTQTLHAVPMVFESAYLNPFGGPIMFGSPDGSLQVITNYTQATVDWNHVVDAGMVGGILDSSRVAGNFTQVGQEHENLMTGKTTDSGIITFSNMSIPSLDMSGTYGGNSSTPTNPRTDCSSSVPMLPEAGLCTQYGFMSSGSFLMSSHNPRAAEISGMYALEWGIPAFFFGGTITATVS